ncbi:MAG: ThiF family adenylyltransferase, partial [Phycisphaerae bacterium]|nr:ThiF family adenylyltransferase [Phycisphaerae bacterium]
MAGRPSIADRYVRQEQFAPLGADGQATLRDASALVIGVGGLGSWMAEILTRAGVGRLRVADDDGVDWTNLARQAMYTEADADTGREKAEAAAARLAVINRDVTVDVRCLRARPDNIESLADGVDVILDGSDAFP